MRCSWGSAWRRGTTGPCPSSWPGSPASSLPSSQRTAAGAAVAPSRPLLSQFVTILQEDCIIAASLAAARAQQWPGDLRGSYRHALGSKSGTDSQPFNNHPCFYTYCQHAVLLCHRHDERRDREEYELVGQHGRMEGGEDLDSSGSSDGAGGGGAGSPARRARAEGGSLRAVHRVPSYWAIADGDLCGASMVDASMLPCHIYRAMLRMKPAVFMSLACNHSQTTTV